jgi:membrane-associated protease RseP (regulator of RpoE activity)
MNLLPIRTFDGGRMLGALLGKVWGEEVSEAVLRGCSFICLFLIWAASVYFLLRVGDGLSLFCFSMSLFSRFFAVFEIS